MNPVLAGFVPIAGTIALGWVLRRTGLVAAGLWPAINRLSYQALLPALLFVTIAGTDYTGVAVGAFLGAAAAGFLTMAGISLAVRPLVPMSGPAFTSVFQGVVRINGFVVFALAQASFTPEGTALIAILFGMMVPLVNTLCVTVLTIFGEGAAGPSPRQVLLRLLANPLIIACLIGGAAAILPPLRPWWVMDTAALAGRAALPLILLSVGASLDFMAMKASPGLLSLSVALKLLAGPLVFLGLAAAIGAEGPTLVALAAIGSAPAAASSYVLAKEMGGDAELMAGHVTATTLLAFITMPLFIGMAQVGTLG